MDFAVPVDHRMKIKKKKTRKEWQVSRLYQRSEKVVDHKSDGNTNSIRRTSIGPQRLRNGVKVLEMRARIETIPS